MVNKCANPECRKTLRYLRDGIVYLFSSRKDSEIGSNVPNSMEHFWLCGVCAQKWILKTDSKNGVQLIPKPRRKTHVPATEANAVFPYSR
jgi:hypothetical protein